MSTKLHILYFRGSAPDASKYIRVIGPLESLVKRDHSIQSFESLDQDDQGVVAWDTIEKALERCHLFLISNTDITPKNFQTFERMVDYCHRNKKIVIYDLDDIYDQVPESNPHRESTLPWDFMRQVIQKANFLTVTGKELQKALSVYHSRIHILPNAVDTESFLPRKMENKRLRIGWAGGVTHLPDLPLITQSVRDLQGRYDFDFVIFGIFGDWKEYQQNAKLVEQYSIHPRELSNPFQRAYVEFVHHMQGIRYLTEPVVSYEDFPKKLASLDLDIGLCPIEDHLFNRCRSAVKFYQYAAVKTITVASHVYPYNNESVILARNEIASWTSAIEILITNPAYRREITEKQYQYVLKNRSAHATHYFWEKLYFEELKAIIK